jgi:hypothetical protein
MPSLLVIRLHPVEPIPGADFTSYLNGLTIRALDISFNNQAGSPIGQAQYLPLPPNPLGILQPPLDPNTRIVQHYAIPRDNPLAGLQPQAVATAIIIDPRPDPPAGGEYRTADIRLVITRNGNEIAHKPIYYNVPVATTPIPADPNAFPGLQPISLHLALPSSAQPSPTVILPEDGTAPNFAVLRTAVETVLNADPGNTTGIADLTAAQCRHIAYEIIWDRMAYPIPLPKRSLEEIYTGPQASDSDDERDRHIFEGDLLTYYTRHNAEADKKRATPKKTKNPFISRAIA